MNAETGSAIVTLGMLAFIAFVVWLSLRPTTPRADEKLVRELRTLAAELTELRDQLSRPAVEQEPRTPASVTAKPQE